MISITALAVISLSAVAASPDTCKPPYGRLNECPDKYMPTPIQTPPDPMKKREIVNLINVARRSESAERRAETNWAAAKLKYESIPDKSSLDAQNALKDYQQLATALRVARDATQADFDAAITKTVAVYRLTPPVSDFTQDTSLADPWRAMRPWAPRYSRDEVLDKESGRMRRRNKLEIQAELLRQRDRAAVFRDSTVGVVSAWSRHRHPHRRDAIFCRGFH